MPTTKPIMSTGQSVSSGGTVAIAKDAAAQFQLSRNAGRSAYVATSQEDGKNR